MGVREIGRSLEQWQMEVKDLRRRMILAPTPRERERWYPVWLLAQHAGSHHHWRFTTQDARAKLRRVYPDTSPLTRY